MKQLEVLLLKGLPASGKSTYAKQLASGGGWVRVNKDDLRAMLHGGKYTSGNEQQVIRVRNSIIKEGLESGKSVVVDDTNFAPVHEYAVREIAERMEAKLNKKIIVRTKFFDTPLEECIKRDLLRPVSVGEKVIRKMYNDYLAPKPQAYVPPAGKPKAIICDIDGTIAHMIPAEDGGRSPYDYSRVAEDTLDVIVHDILNRHKDTHMILFVSGRDSDCRDVTYKWLEDNAVPFNHLYMRTAGDTRNDAIVKEEIFNQYIREHYQVDFVLDDRNRVVDKWRELGLKCLQVAPGDF